MTRLPTSAMAFECPPFSLIQDAGQHARGGFFRSLLNDVLLPFPRFHTMYSVYFSGCSAVRVTAIIHLEA